MIYNNMINDDYDNKIKLLDNIIIKYFKKNNIELNNNYNTEVISNNLYNEYIDLKIEKKIIKDRLKTIKEYRKILKELVNLPFIKQRTDEWFELRKTRLTASDLYDAIYNNISLAKKKAGILIDTIDYNSVPPLKWGTMFEPMAIRIYSQINNDININEFGLIKDKNLEHFGASPDGITDLGIMIEIKCPFSREIKEGFIPPKYKLQILGQLAVCELKECDYIECIFETYDNIDKYLNDNNDININHGIIAEYKNKSNEYNYIYSDPYLNSNEAYELINKLIKEKKENFIKIIAWKLKKINIQKVYFENNEWNNIIPKINEFWNKVESFKGLPIEYKETIKKEPIKYNFINDD